MNGFTGDYTRTSAGFSRRWILWKVPMWEYRTNPARPLTFHWGRKMLTPDRHMLLSDAMSSPPFLWGVKGLAQTDFPKAVYFHDTASKYGGLYIDGEFARISAGLANRLLFLMVCAEGGTPSEAMRIYLGVTVAIPFFWDEKKQARNRKVDGVPNA